MSDSNSPIPPEPRQKVRLSIPQAARYLGCSVRHFYNLAYKGAIPTYLVASHRWVDQEDLDAYIARCKAAGPQLKRSTGKRPPGTPKKKLKTGAAQ